MTLIEQLTKVSQESTEKTLSMMAATEITLKELREKKDSELAWGDITGVIGLTSPEFRGAFAISLREKSALAIVGKMLMEEYDSINEEVIDAIGEITNMISGKVKALLIDSGYAIDWSSPLVIVGQRVRIASLVNSPILQLHFDSPSGDFVVEIGYSA